MSIDDADGALRIFETARLRVLERLREAVEDQVRARVDLAAIDDETIDELVDEASHRAGTSLWRISLAEAAGDVYGLSVHDALAHPAVRSAEQLAGIEPEPDVVDDYLSELQASRIEPAQVPWEVSDEPEQVTEVAPPVAAAPTAPPPVAQTPASPAPAPAPPAPVLRVAAVHTAGIESLAAGDQDIELSLSEAGLDVLRRSNGAAIGRLDWDQITAIEVRQPKRRRKRKPHSLVIKTGGGEAAFELSGLSPEDVTAQVEPALGRLRAAGILAS